MDAVARPSGPVADAARRLRDVQRAMTRLSSLDSVARLVAAAPREACRAVGFERAMLSRLRGDRMALASVSFEADPIVAADFARLARAVRPRLDRCAPEHEAVVRQMPVLVRDARTAPGVYRPLVDAARTAAYVVTPIVRGGRTVGLLHADHFRTGRALGEVDRELLWTFAAGLGWAMDDVAERVRRGAREGESAGERADERVPVARVGVAELGGELAGAPDAPGRLATLTPREREVLGLLSGGASVAAIGQALALSPTTVESSIRDVLRKLGAANRTEAVGLFHAVRAHR